MSGLRTLGGSSATTKVAAYLDASVKSDGAAPTTDDASHTIQYDKNSNANAGFVVASGKLSHTASNAAVAASYLTLTNITSNITRIGGHFTFTSGGNNGSADMIVWKVKPGDSGVFPSNVPDSGFHLELHPDHWTVSAFSGGSISSISTATFATNLATDGTVLRADAIILGSTAYLFLPDGSTATVTDSRIASMAGVYPCWEVYQSLASTDTKAAWIDMWADTRTTYSPGFIDTLAEVGAVRRKIGSVVAYTAPSTNTESGTGSWARSGATDSATHDYSFVTGNQSKSRATGNRAHAVGFFAAQGDAQAHTFVQRATTTDATPTKLGTQGQTSVAGGIPVTSSSVFMCSALVIGRRTDVVGNCGAYKVDFALKRAGGAVALLGTPVTTTIGEDDAAWDVTGVVDSTNNVFHIQVTGAAAKTIRWVANITAVEVA